MILLTFLIEILGNFWRWFPTSIEAKWHIQLTGRYAKKSSVTFGEFSDKLIYSAEYFDRIFRNRILFLYDSPDFFFISVVLCFIYNFIPLSQTYVDFLLFRLIFIEVCCDRNEAPVSSVWHGGWIGGAKKGETVETLWLERKIIYDSL